LLLKQAIQENPISRHDWTTFMQPQTIRANSFLMPKSPNSVAGAFDVRFEEASILRSRNAKISTNIPIFRAVFS
jgi:hypothetical protein